MVIGFVQFLKLTANAILCGVCLLRVNEYLIYNGATFGDSEIHLRAAIFSNGLKDVVPLF